MESKKLGMIIVGIIALFLLVLIINTCNNCSSGCNCKGEESSACEHEYGEWLVEQAPTTSEWGYIYKLCSKCQAAHKITVDPLGRDSRFTKTVVKEPTCTETGIAHFTYSNLTFTVELAMLNHTYSYTEENDDLTTDKFICNCGHTYTSPHSYANGHCHYCNLVQPLTVTYVEADGSTSTLNHYYGDNFVALKRESTMQSYFHGWFDDKNNKYADHSVLTKDLTVYAKWESVIQISSYNDFLKIYDSPDRVYRLTKNIDMGGRLLQPIPNFSGIIDGYDDQNNRGFNIENFVITTDSTVTNHGLFAVNNGEIKNVNFKSCTFSGSITWNSGAALGGIVGVNNGEIYNVSLDQTELNFNLTKREKTSHTYTISIGLLVGKNTGRIEKASANGSAHVKMNCGFNTGLGDLTYSQKHYLYLGGAMGYNSGSVTESNASLTANVIMELFHGSGDSNNGYIYYGSFVGYNAENGTINRSYSVADLNVETPIYKESGWDIPSAHYERSRKNTRIGGFAGRNGGNGDISECFASGNITGYSNSSYYAGGFIGENADTANVKSCYCSTTVSSTANAGGIQMGGFAGNNSAVIQNSYSTGNISAPVSATLGGFIGNNSLGGSITKSYTTSDITATAGSAGYFAGVNDGAIMSSYYTDDIILKTGSATQGKLSTTTYISPIAFNELITKSFLKENLYWDEEGWYIGSDNNPFLVWEFEKLHNYGDPTVILPDCESAGFTVYECVDCGLIFITDVIEPLGHNHVGEYQKDKWTNPTHQTEGKQYYLCSHNGEYGIDAHIHEQTVEKLPHDDISNISCGLLRLQNGVYTYECSCGELIEVESGNITHTPKNVSYKEPSCGVYNPQTDAWEGAEQGNTTGRVCAVCNAILYGCEVLEPHYYDENKTLVVQPATCNQIGIIQKICSLCNYYCEEEVPMLTHTYKNNPLNCDLCGIDRFIIDRSYTAINSLYDLQNVIPNGNYYLNCDLDLNNQLFAPLLSKDDPFVGIFLSNGYKIKNLNLVESDSNKSYVGIFTAIGNGGYVVNLTVENLTITSSNVSSLYAGAVAGINDGIISNCRITGAISVNLSASATRNTIGVTSTSFDYNVGLFSGENGDNGLIINCSVTAPITANYTVNTLLSPQNVSQYFKDLVNNTALTNNVSLSFGAISGVNKGKIDNCSFKGNLTSALNLSNKVGGISRGKAFTYVTLNEGALCGINSGEITNCSSKAHASFLHTKEQASLTSNSAIQVLNVTLRQEYYKIIDNSVFENEFAGIVGKTTHSSKINRLTIS